MPDALTGATEPKVLDAVPGKWLCLSCGAALSGAERPRCGDAHRVVPLSWRRYGPELYRQVEEAQHRAFQADEDRLHHAAERGRLAAAERRLVWLLCGSNLVWLALVLALLARGH
jgi:hypothetical protein